ATNGSSAQFAVTFSEPVTGFDATDVDLTGTTAGGTLMASVSGSGASYTVTVGGVTSAGTVVVSVPAGAAADAAGNASRASTGSNNAVTFDTTPPAVTIDQASGQADPTNAGPVRFAVHFSEPVTGFTGSKVSFAGSTVGGTLSATVTGSGADYAVAVTGMSGTGTVVASIPAGAAFDGAGNASGASTSTDNSVAFDGTTPTVTINQAAGQPDLTGASPVLFTVVFGEPVTGF